MNKTVKNFIKAKNKKMALVGMNVGTKKNNVVAKTAPIKRGRGQAAVSGGKYPKTASSSGRKNVV